jgi:hypothetical protein
MVMVKFPDKVLIKETLHEMVKMKEKNNVDYETFLNSLDRYKTFLISGGYLYRHYQFNDILNRVYEERGY